MKILCRLKVAEMVKELDNLTNTRKVTKLPQTDSPDDIVHYGLARKHKNTAIKDDIFNIFFTL